MLPVMPLELYQVDAFADGPFSGNPAAVVILDRKRPADWMQCVGAEMNLSETAFLLRQDDGFGLRWFTPNVEVELCGHATLASAHVLWQRGLLSAEQPARFATKSGRLSAESSSAGISLDFPALPPEEADAPEGLLAALGTQALWVGRSRFDYLVEVESEAALRQLRPDYPKLRSVDARGVIVTARASMKDTDFVSRFFAPGSGVDEDPVTGSAHCVLAPYWSGKLGPTSLRGYQASTRGGRVATELRGERVVLVGRAVTVFTGELLV